MKMKLTKRAVESIPLASIPPGGQYVRAWDSEIVGFGVKVTPKGSRVYFLKYRFNGRVRWITIGRHGSAWTADRARTEAKRLVGEVAEGSDPAEAKAAAKNAETVGELCDLYIAACERGEVLGRRGDPKKSSTLATDRGRIEWHIRPLLGRKRVIDVTSGDIRRFQSDVAAGKTAADVKTGRGGRAIVTGGRGTAARTLGLLGGIFTFAIDHGLRGDNPTRGVRKFSDAKRERFLSSSELARLGDALANRSAVKFFTTTSQNDEPETPSVLAILAEGGSVSSRASDDSELFDLIAQWEAAQEKAKVLFDKASLPDIENRSEAEDRAAAADKPVTRLARRIRKIPPHTLPGLAAKCRVAFRELGIRETRKDGWDDEEWAIWSAYQDAERLAKSA